MIKTTLLYLSVAFMASLVLLFPAGMLLWIAYPWGWKMALAGLPFLIAAILTRGQFK